MIAEAIPLLHELSGQISGLTFDRCKPCIDKTPLWRGFVVFGVRNCLVRLVRAGNYESATNRPAEPEKPINRGFQPSSTLVKPVHFRNFEQCSHPSEKLYSDHRKCAPLKLTLVLSRNHIVNKSFLDFRIRLRNVVKTIASYIQHNCPPTL